jgi:MFS family permease
VPAQQTEERDAGADRPVFFLGAAIFAAFSVSGGFAPNIWLLLACRFVMGIGGAMMWPVILGMTFSLLPKKQGRARWWPCQGSP